MAPHCGVGDIAAEEAVNGWGGKETHVDTAIVAACEAVFAFVADEVGFDRDAIADFEVGDRGVGGDYYTSRFMAKDMVGCYDHGADAASVPKVNV